MKRLFKILAFLLLLIFLLRGWLFRMTVTYQPVSERPAFSLKDEKLRQLIDNQKNTKSIKAIIRQSLDLTVAQLCFTTGKNEIDPNRLMSSKNAHCVGYAAFFNTVCNELIQKEGLQKDWQAHPVRGKISFLGIDLHQFSDSPFWKDHDFNVVENKATGERFFVDASVKDVLGIVYAQPQK